MEHTTAEPRFYTVLLLTFGMLALTLTVVGVYGVASYTASRRTREMGVRMALGAERGALVSMIVRQGLEACWWVWQQELRAPTAAVHDRHNLRRSGQRSGFTFIGCGCPYSRCVSGVRSACAAHDPD